MRVLMCILLLVATACLLGCGGGGGGGPVRIVGNGSITASDHLLTDGSRGDFVAFTATRDGLVRVRMTSSNVDSFVVVKRGEQSSWNSMPVLAGDDDSGYLLNADCTFWAERGQRYTILFCTYGPNDFGSYHYEIEELSESRSGVSECGTASGKAPVPLDVKKTM